MQKENQKLSEAGVLQPIPDKLVVLTFDDGNKSEVVRLLRCVIWRNTLMPQHRLAKALHTGRKKRLREWCAKLRKN